MTKTKGAVPRRILLATELLIIAALYNYAGLMPETFGGRPLLLAAAALSVSACADTPTSVIYGALCGALADIFSSGGIGFYAIALSLCGYAIPELLSKKLNPNFYSALLLIFSASVVTITARYAVNAFTYGFADSAVLYLYHGLSKIVLTFTAAVPLYFLNRLILGGRR